MEKLRILLVLQTPWGTSLGMSKVHYDLKQEYEKLGHVVEYLDWNRLYPRGQNPYDKVFGPLYSEKILNYLRKHANRYDVIDANFNCIPYPKSDYNFKGVVVYRSHGLQPLYRQIEQSAAYKKMESLEGNKISFKTRIGNFYRYLQKKDTDHELFSSINHADIVHALNQAEYDYFLEYGIQKEKIALIPNGVPDEKIVESDDLIRFVKRNEVTFIGAWTFRKGIKDINCIISEVVKYTILEQINLLGGGENQQIYSFFEARFHPLLLVKPHFSQNELFELLKQTKVGIFPSYVEGFGLAILEQLAFGIPVVAYHTPGPLDILQPLNEGLLIKPGDKVAFGKKVLEILNLNDERYAELSQKCKERAHQFRISEISHKFITTYQLAAGRLNADTTNEVTFNNI
ncbi:MAG: glycosyltransferase [Bacteroidota bacterium]|nr:glycosyltransferase [Bacteroidota bacterium]